MIRQQYTRAWTVETLARELRLSVWKMRQVFRRCYRQSVMDCLEQLRIMNACDLLAATDLPIRRVAAEVGFRDPHYFGRVFRRRLGKTPRAFRTSHRLESVNEPD